MISYMISYSARFQMIGVNIHYIILVHTQYILVCTSLYHYSFPVQLCTEYVLVRTGYELVRTKNPIPVMWFTIPDSDAVTGTVIGLSKPLSS